MKKALITGITGQDGSYLCELLLEKGYEVHGIVRRTSSISRGRLNNLYYDKDIYDRKLYLHYSDLNDLASLRKIILNIEPLEIYHLAGQSHVGLSFTMPEVTAYEAGFSLLGILEILRDMKKPAKFFHASSSEIFGSPEICPQNELTERKPINPYGASKAFATNIVDIYRETYSLYLVNGIMYNHESPRRGDSFVTKKICRAAVEIKFGISSEIKLGHTNIFRDWGHAKDYVNGMWLSLQGTNPENFIFATGELHSIEDILTLSFEKLDLNWKDFYKFDKRFARPDEPKRLLGDPSKAEKKLKWNRSYNFKKLIDEMIEEEIHKVRKI